MIAGVTSDRDRLRRTTALHLLCERARSTPDSVAFRSKHLGVYRERNWHDYARFVAHYASALQSVASTIMMLGSVWANSPVLEIQIVLAGGYPLPSAQGGYYSKKALILGGSPKRGIAFPTSA